MTPSVFGFQKMMQMHQAKSGEAQHQAEDHVPKVGNRMGGLTSTNIAKKSAGIDMKPQ